MELVERPVEHLEAFEAVGAVEPSAARCCNSVVAAQTSEALGRLVAKRVAAERLKYFICTFDEVSRAYRQQLRHVL